MNIIIQMSFAFLNGILAYININAEHPTLALFNAFASGVCFAAAIGIAMEMRRRG